MKKMNFLIFILIAIYRKLKIQVQLYTNEKKILVLSGDPNSINSEIIYKSWKNLGMNLKKRICIVSNLSLLESQFKKLNYKVKFKSLSSIYDKTESKKLNIFNIDLNFKNSFNVEKRMHLNL